MQQEVKFYTDYTRDEVCRAITQELTAGTECTDKDWIYCNTFEDVKKWTDEVLLNWATYNL
jgi:hypothetical protein